MEMTSYKMRQNNLLEKIEEGAFLIPSNKLMHKSNDTEFPFRQNSFFKYFVGFEEADSLLVLCKRRNGEISRHLFLQGKNPEMEMWMGKRMGVEKACELLEIDFAYDNTTLEENLPKVLGGIENLYFDFFNKELSESIQKCVQTLSRQRKSKAHKPHSWHHSIDLMGRLRLIKDQNEILAMKKAAKLSDIGHRAAMALSAPGVNEKEINDLLTYLFSQEAGEGAAYDSIVAGGENALILHYINNNQALIDGDLLLIDAGAQVNTYASDVTRTFPVNGYFSEAQKELYQIVLDTQKTAMSFMKVGNSLSDIHKETCLSLIRSLIEAGILKESAEEALESGSYRKYYPHGTGHWLGLDVHDESPYLQKGNTGKLQDIPLEEGMAFTCEPGLYFPKNDEAIPTQWRGIGIRIEDDILMTNNGALNLTSSIPKEIKEIEEACHAEIKDILAKCDPLPLICK